MKKREKRGEREKETHIYKINEKSKWQRALDIRGGTQGIRTR